MDMEIQAGELEKPPSRPKIYLQMLYSNKASFLALLHKSWKLTGTFFEKSTFKQALDGETVFLS